MYSCIKVSGGKTLKRKCVVSNRRWNRTRHNRKSVVTSQSASGDVAFAFSQTHCNTLQRNAAHFSTLRHTQYRHAYTYIHTYTYQTHMSGNLAGNNPSMKHAAPTSAAASNPSALVTPREVNILKSQLYSPCTY